MNLWVWANTNVFLQSKFWVIDEWHYEKNPVFSTEVTVFLYNEYFVYGSFPRTTCFAAGQIIFVAFFVENLFVGGLNHYILMNVLV